MAIKGALRNGCKDICDGRPVGHRADEGVKDFSVPPDHIHGRLGDPLAYVFDVESLDALEFWIAQDRKPEAEFVDQRLAVFDSVVANRYQGGLFFLKLCQVFLQLPELRTAKGSPVAAVEHEYERSSCQCVCGGERRTIGGGVFDLGGGGSDCESTYFFSRWLRSFRACWFVVLGWSW